MVLVEPQGDANVGAVARSMACFGVKELVLVAPRAKTGRSAYDWACHGSPVLDGRRVCETLEEALAGVSLALALTARPGKRRHRMVTPAELTASVLPLFPPGRVALVFGNEESGLANEHVELCQRLVKIPTDPTHSSLNLGHAVTVMLYELTGRGRSHIGGKPKRSADPAERQRMYSELAQFLEESGYPSHDATLPEEMTKLKDIFERSQLEQWEIRFLLGLVRHLRNWSQGRLQGYTAERLHRILYTAFLDVRTWAAEHDAPGLFRLANVCHNIPLQLNGCREGRQNYAEVMADLEARAARDGLQSWLASV